MFPVNLQLSQYLFSQWSPRDKNTKRTMTVFIVFMSTRNTFEIQLTLQIYRDVGPHSSNCGSIKSDLTLCFRISKLNTWSVSFLSQPWNQRTVIKFIIHVIFADQKLRHPLSVHSVMFVSPMIFQKQTTILSLCLYLMSISKNHSLVSCYISQRLQLKTVILI